MLYKTILQNIQSKRHIIIGSHALHLLCNKHKLNINVDISKKDLDLIIDDDCATFISEKYNIKIQSSKFFDKLVIQNSQGHKVDFLINIRRNIKVKHHVIMGINFYNMKKFSYKDFLYDTKVNVINLEAYISIIQSTGLTKYKNILEELT